MNLLSEITNINNGLASCKSYYTRKLRKKSCGSDFRHEFTRSRLELLTDDVIQNVVHFCLSHAQIGKDGQTKSIVFKKDGGDRRTFYVRRRFAARISRLCRRTRLIKEFHERINRAATQPDIENLPNAFRDHLYNVDLCLNEKIDILLRLSDKCRNIGVARPSFDEEFRRKLSEGANFILRHYFQCLFGQTRSFDNKDVQHLFNVIGPIVTEIDFYHPIHVMNDILKPFEDGVPSYDGIFPNAVRICLGLFSIRPEEPYDPLIFLGRMLGYQQRTDIEEIGIELREPISDENFARIVSYFPASTCNPQEKAVRKLQKRIQQLMLDGQNAGHSHSQCQMLAAVAGGQVPIFGPTIELVENASLHDHVDLFANLFHFVGEMGESFLRTMEICHITGLHHLFEELGTGFRLMLDAVPVVGTALLVASFAKHTAHLIGLTKLRKEIKRLNSEIQKCGDNSEKIKAVKNFLGTNYYPKDHDLKKKILKHICQVDPRLQNDAMEALAKKFAKKRVKVLNTSKKKEVYNAYFHAVQNRFSDKKLDELTKKIQRNIIKQIGVEAAQLCKTSANVGLSITALVVPMPPIVALPILTTNVLASLGLAGYEHKLQHESFISHKDNH